MAREIWTPAKNPLNALLLSLAVVSYFLGDIRAAIVIAVCAVGNHHVFHSRASSQSSGGQLACYGKDDRNRIVGYIARGCLLPRAFREQ